MDINHLKQIAAETAVGYLQSGMVIGLGTGSTARFAILRIAQLRRDGALTDIICIPTSKETEELAQSLGIPLTTLQEHPDIDITIDGADEVSADLDLIKGGGGALLREKIVAQASMRNIIITDAGKLSEKLGEKWCIPIEVIPFALEPEKRFLESIGATVTTRSSQDGSSFITDEHNLILDARFGVLQDPASLSVMLNERAGIVEHGLFLGIATEVIAAFPGEVVAFQKGSGREMYLSKLNSVKDEQQETC